MQAIAPPAVDGMYNHSLYSIFPESNIVSVCYEEIPFVKGQSIDPDVQIFVSSIDGIRVLLW
jgi:hypothetical protein